MMTCLKCELTRAKIKAALLSSVGTSPSGIAAHLSKAYGERYYVEDGAIYRASKLPPYTPHLIKDK